MQGTPKLGFSEGKGLKGEPLGFTDFFHSDDKQKLISAVCMAEAHIPQGGPSWTGLRWTPLGVCGGHSQCGRGPEAEVGEAAIQGRTVRSNRPYLMDGCGPSSRGGPPSGVGRYCSPPLSARVKPRYLAGVCRVRRGRGA